MTLEIICAGCSEAFSISVIDIYTDKLVVNRKHLPIYKDELFCSELCMRQNRDCSEIGDKK